MSRRYGRNQKRAHRQRIAELEAAYTREQHLNAYLRNQLDALRVEVEDAKRELGQDHTAFVPAVARLESREGCVRYPMVADLRPFAGQSDWETTSLTSLVLHTLELNALEHRRDAIHLNAQLADGRVCYAISEQGLAQISDRRLHRYIVESLAQQLTLELRRLYPRRK